MDKFYSLFSAWICAALSFCFGRLDGMLIALIALMAFDYITGVIRAGVNHDLCSSVGFKGIARKVLILALVAVGNLVDVHIIGDGSLCRSLVIGFYVANEALSIIENAIGLGLPVPKKLITIIRDLKDKNDKDDT
jgi:toxin secretion/phage lysis holin